MFLLFIADLPKIRPLAPLTVIFPAHAMLPHEALLAQQTNLTLETLLAEAKIQCYAIEEDPATSSLVFEFGWQFIQLGQLYRRRLKYMIKDLVQQVSETVMAELKKLDDAMNAYEVNVNINALPPPVIQPNPAKQRMQHLRNLIPTLQFADAGLPIPQINWPKTRNLKTYLELVRPKLLRNLNQSGLAYSLQHRPCAVLDAGVGEGVALAEIKSEETFTIGMTMHAVQAINAKNFDVLCYSTIPHGQSARVLHAKLINEIDLLFDIYGPCTYAENPLHVLLFYALLIARGGSALIVISCLPQEDMDISPIGFAGTRHEVVQFFETILQIKLTISRTFLHSSVTQNTLCKDFILQMFRPLDAPEILLSLDALLVKANAIFNAPHIIKKKEEWGKFDGNNEIHGKDYSLPSAMNYSYPWRDHIESIHLDYVVQQGIGVRFHFVFGDEESLHQFTYQFTEFFVAHQNRDWQLSTFTAPSAATVVYFDKAMDERAIKHLYTHAASGWGLLYQTEMDEVNNRRPVEWKPSDIIFCADAAILQLQQVMQIPYLDKVKTTHLVESSKALTVHTLNHSGLFSLPATQREVDRLQNQYIRGMKK